MAAIFVWSGEGTASDLYYGPGDDVQYQRAGCGKGGRAAAKGWPID